MQPTQDLSGELERMNEEFARMLRVWPQVRLGAEPEDKHCENENENENMKKLIKALAIAGVAVLGYVGNGTAQVQQSISFSLTVFDQTDTSVRAVHVTTRDI